MSGTTVLPGKDLNKVSIVFLNIYGNTYITRICWYEMQITSVQWYPGCRRKKNIIAMHYLQYSKQTIRFIDNKKSWSFLLFISFLTLLLCWTSPLLFVYLMQDDVILCSIVVYTVRVSMILFQVVATNYKAGYFLVIFLFCVSFILLVSHGWKLYDYSKNIIKDCFFKHHNTCNTC